MKQDPAEQPAIDFDTPVVARFASYLEGVLVAHTVAIYFNLARDAGCKYEDTLDLMSKHLPFSRTTLHRRLKDWEQKDAFLRLTETDQYLDFVSCTGCWPSELQAFLRALPKATNGLPSE